MNSGLYAAASGMLAQNAHHNMIATNLANVSTAGYRRQVVGIAAFNETLNAQLAAAGLTNQATNPLLEPKLLHPVSAPDYAEGAIRQTGNPTDFALRGEGFFAVQTRDGNRNAYTRDGAFQLDAEQRLVTQQGHLVLNEDGAPITIGSATWEVTPTGDIRVDGVTTGRMKLVVPAAGTSTQRLDDGLWQFGAVTPATAVRVEQRAIEGSNVNVVSEMVTLISAMRNFEANQKTVQAIDSTLDRAVNDIGRV